MHNSAIAQEKIRAYEATSYRLGHTSQDIVLKIGQHSARLAHLFKTHGVNCGAFLTAYNPQGTQQSDAQNAFAHAKLAEQLLALGLPTIEGSGSEEGSDWPEECSYFAFGLTLEAASKIGAHFNQDAIVWVGEDAVPQLVLLR